MINKREDSIQFNFITLSRNKNTEIRQWCLHRLGAQRLCGLEKRIAVDPGRLGWEFCFAIS